VQLSIKPGEMLQPFAISVDSIQVLMDKLVVSPANWAKKTMFPLKGGNRELA